jgi:hypothetical protein
LRQAIPLIPRTQGAVGDLLIELTARVDTSQSDASQGEQQWLLAARPIPFGNRYVNAVMWLIGRPSADLVSRSRMVRTHLARRACPVK